MTTTETNNEHSPVKDAAVSFLLQVYGAILWLLILVGGMVAAGTAFLPQMTAREILTALVVGALSVAFGLGSARLLNRDIRQTAPVVWF